jgi:hypothetical protein
MEKVTKRGGCNGEEMLSGECKGEETSSGECQCQMDPPRACAV